MLNLHYTLETPISEDLANAIGRTQQYVGQILEAKEFRERNTLKLSFSGLSPKTTNIRRTSMLPDDDRVKVLKAVEDKKLPVSGK